MSRIGKYPVEVPKGVTVTLNGQEVAAKGPKGELKLTLVEDVTVEQVDAGLKIAPREDTQRARAMWGLSRTLVKNLVDGVTDGFTKTLEINGVGYRAAIQGKNLQLNLGFSHEVLYPIPEGIDIKCTKPTEIVITGIDKQKVGQVAAEIRGYRGPEPYKGKGVKYAGEYIFRKEGKKK
ncbi:MAG: 50S ribosomal protein L6 [Parvibaculum sp.]|jgi:large subunit ribosomal protein L6|uniref:50S ribosomal protein L6 n=1 Tax=Parvibaculum sp. TaxID=2024848 RepID=UPI0035BACA5E